MTFKKFLDLVKRDIKKVHNFFKQDIWDKLRVLAGWRYFAAMFIVVCVYLIVMYFVCILVPCFRAMHAAVDTAANHSYINSGARKKI